MPTPFGLSWLLYLSAGVGLSTSIIPRKCYLLLNEASIFFKPQLFLAGFGREIRTV